MDTISLCPHLVGGEGISKATRIRALIPLWGLHLRDPITSETPHLLTPSHCGVGLQLLGLEGMEQTFSL